MGTDKQMNYVRSLLITIFLFLIPSHSFAAVEKKICLTMIVKNEEKIIERCLDNVKDVVDAISICDTGSTDQTVQKIEQYMKKNKIVGKVHHHTWKNFGHNRTLSVEAAQKMLKEQGFVLDDTYLLLIDADMVAKFTPQFTKNELKDDSYLVLQTDWDHSYYNTRLIRASLPWHCVGVTHEYWSCKVPSQQSKLKTMDIDDRNDGGCKADKFERDIRLLTQGLVDEPDNVRYMFYLAQSYKSLDQWDKALEWYQKRIEKGGWKEEVWYSKLMIGQCYEQQGKWDLALKNYLEAYQYNPERAEPLQEISSYYRLNGQHHLAYTFAKQGSGIPYPEEQILFVSHPVYNYLFDEDISISAYFTPHKQEGYAAANRLILKKCVPHYIRDQAYKNMLFYVEKLKDAHYKPIVIDLPVIHEGLSSHYNPMNPTIQKTATGYNVICRTVNYMQIHAKHFKSLDWFDPTETIRTRNFFLEYDRDFNLLSQKEIVEDLPRQKKPFSNIQGLEDCRMFRWNQSTWFSCTTLDTSPCGVPQISLCKLADKSDRQTIQVENLIPLFGPDPTRCEKNWLPFVKNQELYFIYSYDPLTIYKPMIDLKENKVPRKVELTIPSTKYDFSHFSGSASPIPYDQGYLMLVHENVYDNQRIYMHRFVYMDNEFNITQVSKPFIFLHKGIEYCCGMTLDHSETKLLMTIGIEDCEAYLCEVDCKTVKSLLEPL